MLGCRADPATRAQAGIAAQESLQVGSGYFPGDYGGPLFLLPGLLIACHTTGVLDSVLGGEHRREMLRYLGNHQNADGGWGLHTAGPSTMMGTSLKCVRPAQRSAAQHSVLQGL